MNNKVLSLKTVADQKVQSTVDEHGARRKVMHVLIRRQIGTFCEVC